MMQQLPEDLQRMQQAYANREENGRYSLLNKANLFTYQQRQHVLVDLLCCFGITSLKQLTILEIGSGSGGVMLDFVQMGAKRTQIYGIDLLMNRLQGALYRQPGLQVACADGRFLPYRNQTFDLVLQFTAFSSMLDLTVKQAVAKDVIRVLKPNGLVIWYDFWLNPTNPQTQGITKKEIHRLFPDRQIHFRKVTLAPPISRRIVPISWTVCAFLERLTFLNTHYLAIIHANPNE